MGAMPRPRALTLAALLTAACACAGTGGATPERAAPQADGPPPPTGCALELRTELSASGAALTWGAEATVALRVVNVSGVAQDVIVGRSCPGADIRVDLGDARFDPTDACMAGACMEDPPPLRFALEPGASRVVGELTGALGPTLSCMDAELPRGEHELRATARVLSKQQTCARGQVITLE